MVSLYEQQFWNAVCHAFTAVPLTLSLAIAVALNANRQVTGVLRGFDQFMNIVLDNTVDEKAHTDIGMVVSLFCTL